MDLNRRFRLNSNSKIALVGSGGKTTLMFQLARDFGGRVICTTSTHLALDQIGGADLHLVLKNLEDIPDSQEDLEGEVILFTGPEVEPNRVGAPVPDFLAALAELADSWNCPLIIEADGARQLPIKAPADHEPPIPDFSNVVITVIGLSGLGKPLDDEWVHRPALFSSLVGIPQGSILTSEHLVKALISPRGGLKNIPDGARRILLINQIDSFPNWKAFLSQMDLLLAHYSAVGFAVLEDQMLLEVHERIAGIILAAGGSSRFGEPKQLLDWFGIPLVQHAVEIARAGGLSPILVVTGADHDTVSEVIRDQPVNVICNANWQRGQSTSIQAGIQALSNDVGGVVFLLVDQPLIPPALIQALVKTHNRNPAPIIQPAINGKPGNPVFFDQQLFADLTRLEGDSGGRALFNKYPPRQVPWDDGSSQMDIDTPEDYQKLRFSKDSSK